MRLDHAIRALLRRQPGVSVGPLLSLPPIGPVVGVGEWAPQTVWQGAGGGGGSSTLRIEPGLLCLPPVRADIEYPVLMVRPTWLASWAGGSGATVPDSDPARTTLLLGELAADPELVPPYGWPDGAEYEGLLYSSAAAMQRVLDTSVAATRVRYPAGPYTGGARLWAEACLSSGRLLSDRVPPGCTTAPGALGLIWSPTDTSTGLRTAWAIDIDAAGLWAWEMACSPLVQPTLAAVCAGDYTGDAAHLAWLDVLADISPVGGPQTLLTAAEIAPAYSGHGEEVAEVDTAIVDDAFPSGATVTAPYGSSYAWVTTPAPHTGTACLRVSTVYDPAATWFEGSATLATLPPGGSLYVWVYLPSATTWRELLIQVYTGSLRVCAYWGTDDLNQYVHSMLANRVRIGDLPGARNAWVKLEIPAGAVGLENQPVKGLAFWAFSWDAEYTVYWDKAGVYAPPESWAEGDAAPLQRGWVWAADGSECSIITHRTYRPGLVSQAGESALSTVAITWADGVPSATISIGDWARSRPYWTSHKFWYGRPDDLALLRHGQIWPGNTDCAASAPIVCWYEGDALKVVRYYKVSITSTADRLEGTTNVNLLTCGDYAYSRTGTSGAFTTTHGGYGLSEPPPMVAGSGGWTETTLTRSEGAWSDGYTGGVDWAARAANWDALIGMQNSSAGACACGVCYPNQEGLVSPQTPRWMSQSAAGKLVVDSASVTDATGGHIYVYLRDSPDALWGVSGQRYARKQGSGKATWEKTIKYAGRVDLVDYNTGELIQAGWLGSKAVMFVCYYGDTPHCVGYGAPSSQEPAYDLADVWEGAAVARIGGTEHDAGTWEDWDHLDANGLEPPYQVAVGAMVSARGSAIYRAEPGGDWESDCGISASDAAAAHTWCGG